MSLALFRQLTRGWYDAIVDDLNLCRRTFQLAQGVMPIGNTSDALWRVFDAVPPRSRNNLYPPAQYASFSTTYGAVVNNLIPQQTPDEPVVRAVNAWLAGGATAAYDRTFGELHAAVNEAPRAEVTLTPARLAEAARAADAADDIQAPEGSERAACEALCATLAPLFAPESGVPATATVTFEHLLHFAAAPLQPDAPRPDIGEAWYVPDALRLAYTSQGSHTVWKRAAPTWADVFGADGSLPRVVHELIVADGVATRIDTEASNGATAARGLAPLDGRTQAGAETLMFPVPRTAGDGRAEARAGDAAPRTLQAPTGNPFVLGVVVWPIERFLGLA